MVFSDVKSPLTIYYNESVKVIITYSTEFDRAKMVILNLLSNFQGAIQYKMWEPAMCEWYPGVKKILLQK